MRKRIMVDKRTIEKLRKKVIKDFPEYKTVKPIVDKAKIKPQKTIYRKLAMGIPKRERTIYKMRFKKNVKTKDNVSLKKILTVTFSDRGSVIKITETK